MLGRLFNLSLTEEGSAGNDKVFRCPLHGYIAVSTDLCSRFIDTDIFQRLRDIQQTSMRPLFPSARHDRFCHSLGVYHLGKIACKCLMRNSTRLVPEIQEDKREVIERSFLIACLLHDCGHSPFSHVLENNYETHNRLDPRLSQLMRSDTTFPRDFKEATRAAPHEKVSAIIALKRFRHEIVKSNGDPSLVARMILGCTYKPTNPCNRLRNALIQLLNSASEIDVDKLDYIDRDTWASGVNNVSIDVTRLLSSLVLDRTKTNEWRLGYHKSALSVLESVFAGRNYLYQWIYGHHKVVYYSELVKRAARALAAQIGGGFDHALFSVDALLKAKEAGGELCYLPRDGDVLYLIKKHRNHIKEAEELLSHKHRRPLWKSFGEYWLLFHRITDGNRRTIMNRCLEELPQYWVSDHRGEEDSVWALSSKVKMLDIRASNIYVYIDNDAVPLSDILPAQIIGGPDLDTMFYVYGPDSFLEKKETVIAYIRNLI